MNFINLSVHCDTPARPHRRCFYFGLFCSLSPSPHQFLERYTTAGLKYYLNPQTNQTTWSPSRSEKRRRQALDESLDSSADASVSRLPPGWEKKRTDAGREYYVDHNRRLALRSGIKAYCGTRVIAACMTFREIIISSTPRRVQPFGCSSPSWY